MKGNEFPVNIGGLLRCCIATLEDYTDEAIPGESKSVCKHCGDVTGLRKEGFWAWGDNEKNASV